MGKLTLITGRSGSGKTEYCLTQLSEILEENPHGTPLILLVPEQASFQMEKALAEKIRGQGFMGAQIFGFRRFSHKILQETGGLWLPPLSDSGRQLVLGRILRSRKEELLTFGKAATRPRFADTLSELIQEFRTHRISPDSLKEAAEALPTSPLKDKLSDLALLYQDFMSLLEDHYRDTSEALDRTVKIIPTCDWLKEAKIWIDGFDRFTPQEWEILTVLLEHTKELAITLTLDDPSSAFDEASIFHRPAQTFQKFSQIAKNTSSPLLEKPLELFHRSKKSEIKHLEKTLYGVTETFPQVPQGIKLISAANPRQELISIARDMMNKVRQENYRWKDLALLLRQDEPYRELAESVFTEYQIPFYRDQNVQPLHHPVVEVLRSAFEVISSRWLPEPIFRAAKTGMLKVEIDSIDQLENYVLEFGLKGKSRWSQENPWQYARRYALEDDALPDDDEMARLDLLDRTRRAIAAPILALEKHFASATTVRELATGLYFFWETLDLDSQLEGLALEEEKNNDPTTARLHRQIGNEFRALLDEIVDLLGEETLNLAEFAKLFTDGLEGLAIRLIPPGLDHVTIHSLQSILPNQIKCAYLPGANDGLFPARTKPEGLLSEADRMILQSTGLELSPSHMSDTYNERLIAYRGLTGASHFLWLSYSVATREGGALSPSILVNRLKELFPGLPTENTKPEADWISLAPSETLFRANTSFISLAGALRRIRDEDLSLPYWKEVYNYYQGHSRWHERLTDLTNSLLGKNEVTALSPTLAKELYSPQGRLKGSVTRLETYYSCPFRHYAQYGLKLKKRPEFRLAPPEIGVLLHGVLKKYGQTLLEENKKWHQLSATDRESLANKIIHQLAGKLQNEILYSNAQYQYFLERITRTVNRAIDHLTSFSAHTAFEPLALEQSFGDRESGWQPLRFTLQEGITLEISGQIDRIDGLQTENKTYLLVIDYKSGSKKLILNEAYHGISLQLLTYLLVALEGAQHLTHSKEAYGAGLLYYYLKNPIGTTNEPLTPEEAKENLKEELRMPGWILKEKSLIQTLETDFEEANRTQFIPKISLKKDGDFNGTSAGNLKSQEDFNAILEHLKKLLEKSGQEILDGNIHIAPYQLKKYSPCSHCPYKPVCSFDRFQGNQYRELEALGDKEILRRLQEGGGDHE